MRSPGAVYTLVRISNTDATRPSKEMQSGNVAIRIALTTQHPYQRKHHHQRTPESSRQEHQMRGVDGKSPKEAVRDRQILSMDSPPSLQLRDFSDPGHPQNALYSTLKEGFPTGASHELLTQATGACYMSGMKKPDDLGNVYGNAEKIMFSSNSPLGSMAVVDVTKTPPSVQQTMQHVQQHDQQQAQMMGQIQAQNSQINQQVAQGPTPGMPGR